MKVAKYFLPTSSHKYRRKYRFRGKSTSSIFSALGIVKFICKMMFYTVSSIIGLLILCMSLGYKLYKRIDDYRHYKEIGMNSIKLQQDILKMDGFQFEVFCAELYKALGHKCERTESTNDHGRDCIIDDNTFVECKHYTGTNLQVGREICQKLIGSMEYFNITRGIIFTTGKIHNNAFEYAKGLKYKSLEFVNLDDIMQMLFKVDVNKIPNIMSKAMAFTNNNLLEGMDELNTKIDIFNKNLDKQY